MSNQNCARCGKTLEEIGIPPQIRAAQLYGRVVDVGSAPVPEDIKQDPFLYRGFFCSSCRKAFCPTCSGMQGEICPECRQRTLLPAYRPLLKKAAAGTASVPDMKSDSVAMVDPSAILQKAGPERGFCPHCGAFLLERGSVRVRLFIKEGDRGPEQGIGCPECQKELDAGQFNALRGAGKSISPEEIDARAAASKSGSANTGRDTKKRPCYVATAAFGSTMHPEVALLRRFRDAHLSRSSLGILFIRSYDVFGPVLAALVRRSTLFRRITQGAIRGVCAVLRASRRLPGRADPPALP